MHTGIAKTRRQSDTQAPFSLTPSYRKPHARDNKTLCTNQPKESMQGNTSTSQNRSDFALKPNSASLL